MYNWYVLTSERLFYFPDSKLNVASRHGNVSSPFVNFNSPGKITNSVLPFTHIFGNKKSGKSGWKKKCWEKNR